MPNAYSRLSVIKADLEVVLKAMDELADKEKIDLLDARGDLEDTIFEVRQAQERIVQDEEIVYRRRLAELHAERDDKLRSMGIEHAPWNEIEVK